MNKKTSIYNLMFDITMEYYYYAVDYVDIESDFVDSIIVLVEEYNKLKLKKTVIAVQPHHLEKIKKILKNKNNLSQQSCKQILKIFGINEHRKRSTSTTRTISTLV